ncbi:MAG TPA: FkbM family methyltransferase, partial [Thermomicrobiales bacterium]
MSTASGVERVVAAWDGTRFHVRAGDAIEEEIARGGAFEPEVQLALFPLLRPGDNVIDAGANVGCHACPMATRVAPHGRVLAIEPVGRLADRLEANCRLNGLANVVVARSAVSSGAGWRPLVVPDAGDSNQGNASFHRAPSTTSDVVAVATTTIDALVAEVGLADVRLIKTDLEGEDFAALVGARETLRRWRPTIAFEYHRGLWAAAGHTLEHATGYLTGEFGYRVSSLAQSFEV